MCVYASAVMAEVALCKANLILSELRVISVCGTSELNLPNLYGYRNFGIK